MDEATRLQRDRVRIARWRAGKRQDGKKALTIWLPEDQKLYIEDLALKRHVSPSALVEQALTQVYPGSSGVTDTATDTDIDTAIDRIREQWFAFMDSAVQEIRALRQEPRHEQPGTVTVTDTVTDTALTLTPDLNTVPDTSTVTVTATDIQPPTESGYDSAKFYLGRGLCPGGHDFNGTGRTLLRVRGSRCDLCENARRKERRQQQRTHTTP